MKILFSFLVILLLQTPNLFAQSSRDFLIATQLIRVQDYERAQKILEDLVQQEPANQAFLQQLILCQINLKAYDAGISLLTNPKSKISGNLVLENELANLYHLASDTAKAFAIWDKLIAQNNKNLVAFQTVAQTMMDRREFARAAEVYKTARKQFKNSYLFLNELANAYLQSNNYQGAALELISLLENNPGRNDLVQRQFARYNDEFLLDEAILILEESGLERTSKEETITQAKRELLLWLYLERNVEKRAIAWAITLERKSPTDFFVYNVAQNLIRKESFEMADQALNFYLEKEQKQLRPLALEAKATLYVKWAKKLNEQGLSVLGKADSLLKEAANLYEFVVSSQSDYEPKEQVLLKLIDLNLDQLGDVEKARKYYELVLKSYEKNLEQDQKDFLEGRFALLEGNFRNARVSLTKANKSALNADMLEKSRYFLALTDFYAGDYEFSKIQLKSVERQPSSFYANDALKLRNWIRKGIQKDSVLPELDIFSKAMFAFSRTEFKACFDLLSSNFSELNQLQEDAATVLVTIYRKSSIKDAYNWLKTYNGLTQYEQLYFEQLSSGYILLKLGDQTITNAQLESDFKAFLSVYPAGFYADKVRSLLQDIMDTAL